MESKSADEVFPEYFIVRVGKFNPGSLKPDFMEQWMNYLKTGLIREDYDAPGLEKARKTLIYDNMTPAEKKQYRDHLDDIRIQQDAINDSRAEGFATGKAEGRAEGRAEGHAEGRAEGIKDTAKKLIQLGFDTSMIVQATGLSVEETENLRKLNL